MADFPNVPVPPQELVKYIADHPEKQLTDIMASYRQYEAHLRSVFAQDRKNPILDDPFINLLPLFTPDTPLITTRARNLELESEEEKSRYIMALPDDKRRAHGSPATVANLTEFRNNFNIFSESALTELDWSNVVAAGSSVINCLLPVPDEFNVNKRKLREYYHEKFCPASDVDLFLYGLTHEQAIEKMNQIEQAVRDSVLHEVTVVRTKYAVTIASQYPVRHIQIVLRVYKSVGEILTGFDIDAAGGAYDGKQVYVTPRALGSFISQINHIDLTRRSPSYENRLSKYSHRNFEVYWPDLDRSRVDPTIYERSFQRTLGLARLLVLERLPTSSVREAYQNKRRQERGRPELYRSHFQMYGNIKNNHEDEVADWLSEEDVSSYHTFTIPYGQKFNAKKIEKLCYSRDLLLNAEWNQPKERKVYLHRHPAFFGRVQDVIQDCCGSCLTPTTKEEIETAEKEAEIYISGKIAFLIDDPGRQQIGSFNPLTEEDWTDMAYVGNTARLCQSIVNNDVDDVINWLSQEGADPNTRDYTGRTPLHLAVIASTADIVKCLVDHGARLTARLADGRTALHLASSIGNVDMIKILMDKSNENEAALDDHHSVKSTNSDEGKDSDDSDIDEIDVKEAETDIGSVTTGSFVKLKTPGDETGDIAPQESADEPDYYQIDVLAWDVPCSPLHLAIVEGHEEAVKMLCDYGADAILPVKFLKEDNAAILTLTLALSLRGEKAISMAKLLLGFGAISSQADTDGWTAFHKYVASGRTEMTEVLLDNDKAAIKAAINHMVISGYSWNTHAISPLQTAIEADDTILVMKLLNTGALTDVDFETWLKSAKLSSVYGDVTDFNKNQQSYAKGVEQPLITAIRFGNVELVAKLLAMGSSANTLTTEGNSVVQSKNYESYTRGESALNIAESLLRILKNFKGDAQEDFVDAQLGAGADEYVQTLTAGSYQRFIVSRDIKTKKENAELRRRYQRSRPTDGGMEQKKEAIKEAVEDLLKIKAMLLESGAKRFKELHPEYKYLGGYYDNDDDEDDAEDDAAEKPRHQYSFTPSFSTDPELTEARREGYMELMQAAWDGDKDRVEALTLHTWGPENAFMPLKADITDGSSNSPFSIAFLRGHIETAQSILEIVQAQWTPVEKDEVRYKLRGDGTDNEDDSDEDECYSDSDSDSESDEPRIVSENVDKKFTIDNVGHVSLQVKSHTTPLQIICKSVNTYITEKKKQIGTVSLFRYVLFEDDVKGLKTLLDLAERYSKNGTKQDNEKLDTDDDDDDDASANTFTFPTEDFKWGVENGKVDLLRHIIKRTGAGIPLDHLLKKSGVEVKKKPRYYQGLTVYGKKRNDWATAGRNMVVRSTGLKTPPLLHAALGGAIETVEFFLSDAPHRLYGEFSKSKAGRDEKRLENLRKSPGGIDRVISKWLGADNDWVLHCAVAAKPSEASLELVKYLIEACPATLEKKSSDGETPLMLACSLGRYDFIKVLIKAGADQSTRNGNGYNILHAALSGRPPVCAIEGFLKLLDPDLRSHLFLQKTNLYADGATPLHLWISNHNCSYQSKKLPCLAMLKLLLSYSKGQELEMLNSAGDTCLHTAIMRSDIGFFNILATFDPKLLHRENAVGRTPAEVSHEALISINITKPDTTYRWRNNHVGLVALPQKDANTFQVSSNKVEEQTTIIALRKLQENTPLQDTYKPVHLANILRCIGVDDVGPFPVENLNSSIKIQAIWDISRTIIGKTEGVRRLVSLNEANDVARRLGESHSRSRYFTVESRRDDDDEAPEEEDDDDDDKKKQDFIAQQRRQIQNTAWNLPFWAEEDRPAKCEICERQHGSYYDE